jgi:hypothetical protein
VAKLERRSAACCSLGGLGGGGGDWVFLAGRVYAEFFFFSFFISFFNLVCNNDTLQLLQQAFRSLVCLPSFARKCAHSWAGHPLVWGSGPTKKSGEYVWVGAAI